MPLIGRSTIADEWVIGEGIEIGTALSYDSSFRAKLASIAPKQTH
jgi:hypothetical protein